MTGFAGIIGVIGTGGGTEQMALRGNGDGTPITLFCFSEYSGVGEGICEHRSTLRVS